MRWEGGLGEESLEAAACPGGEPEAELGAALCASSNSVLSARPPSRGPTCAVRALPTRPIARTSSRAYADANPPPDADVDHTNQPLGHAQWSVRPPCHPISARHNNTPPGKAALSRIILDMPSKKLDANFFTLSLFRDPKDAEEPASDKAVSAQTACATTQR